MAWDLSRTPTTGLRVQCCGDAHLSNFGVFAAPDRRLVFDLNDFDETLPAPFEWDVKRLVASFVVAARDNGHRPKDQRAAARAAARVLPDDDGPARDDALPRRLVRARSTSRTSWIGSRRQASKAALKAAEKNVAKARRRTSLGSLAEVRRAGRRQLPDQGRSRRSSCTRRRTSPRRPSASSARGSPTTQTTLTPDRRLVLDHYHFVDFARKVVGVGSVGTEAFMILLMGDRDDDPLFLQVKEANTSVLAPFAGDSEYAHQGERVVQGQRVTQAASDAFLGWVTGTGRAPSRVLRAPAARHEGLGDDRDDGAGAPARSTARSAARRWRARTRAPATPRRSPATSATTTRSTARSSGSPSRTPTRTTADYAAFTQAADDERIAVERGV